MAHRETCVLRPEAHTPAERVARRVQTARYVAMCERYSMSSPGPMPPGSVARTGRRERRGRRVSGGDAIFSPGRTLSAPCFANQVSLGKSL